MKAKDIKIGATYTAKISGKLAPVRIDREAPDIQVRYRGARVWRIGGWWGTNLDTGRQVRIRSASKLRGLASKTKLAVALNEVAAALCSDCGKPHDSSAVGLSGHVDGICPDCVASRLVALTEATALANYKATHAAALPDDPDDDIEPEDMATDDSRSYGPAGPPRGNDDGWDHDDYGGALGADGCVYSDADPGL